MTTLRIWRDQHGDLLVTDQHGIPVVGTWPAVWTHPCHDGTAMDPITTVDPTTLHGDEQWTPAGHIRGGVAVLEVAA